MASTSRKIAATTSAQIVGRLTSSAIGIITVGLSTRYLGVADYGALTAATVFISIFGTFTDVGISNIAVRELAQKPKMAERIIGNVLAMRLLLGLVMVVIAVAIAPIIYHGNSDIVLAVAFLSATLLLQTIQTSLSAILTSQYRGYLTVIGDITSKIVIVVCILAAAAWHTGFFGIVLAYLIGAIVSCLSDVYFSLRAVRPNLRPDKTYVGRLVKMTLPFSAAVILNTIYFNVDGFMLSVMRPVAEVGLYGVAYKIVQLTMSFAIFFATAVFPLMAAQSRDLDRLREIVDKAARILSLMAAPVVFGVIALAPEAIMLLGGKAFAAAALPMSILMIGNYFVYLNTGYGNALLASDHQNVLVRITGITFVVNVLCNLALIPLFGVNGAASSVVVAEWLQFFVVRHYYRQYIGRPYPVANQVKPLASGLVMFAVIIGTKYALERAGAGWAVILLCGMGVGVAIYGSIVLWTGQLRAKELRELVGGSA